MIVVENLSKSFKTRKATLAVLDKVSFTAYDGEVFGLLGPNGAGKTTALRTIATLLRPDAGTVAVDHYDSIRDSRPVRDSLGFLTSEMQLTGHLSGREMLQYFGALNHMPKEVIAARIEQLANTFSMDTYLDNPIARLSSGMKQKISIAISLIHEPQNIVFDEPTSNLDVLAVKVVSDFIRAAKASGKCVVLSTHVLSDAQRLCDRIAILHQGKILIEGPLATLLHDSGTKDLEELFFQLINGK